MEAGQLALNVLKLLSLSKWLRLRSATWGRSEANSISYPTLS